ncbi:MULTISPECIES: PAS domain S-box protein [Planococcus]|uniref:Diguanylate cyclase n=1 Tax=Planococcus faecalis TaxID=1598147 RepID=A0ABN4XTY9_9BACL|nr:MULTISPECIES: PAS domain S-box protein [Planococcus]AQU80689.1 diguanylate cyclase [Planococcus faecalis]MDJ0333136.1 PAS domain S-box protein [Planococcus sp. S3-L1]
MKNFLDKSKQTTLLSTELFDLMQDAIFLVAEDHETFRYVYANAAAFKILSLQQTDIGKNIEDVLSPARAQIHFEYYHKVHASQKSIEMIESIETESGEILGEVVLNPILTEDGYCHYILATVKDITEQRNKDNMLQETLQSLDAERQKGMSIFENNIHAVFEFDQQKKIVNVNAKAIEITGFSKEELLVQSLFSLTVENQLVATLLNFEQALAGIPIEFEMTLYTKKHEVVVFQVNTVPIVIEETLTGVYAIAKNVTTQKKTEWLLQESEQRYKSLVANHPYGIFVFDEKGRLKNANPGTENITGYSVEELLETSFIAKIIPDELEKISYHFHETITNNKSERYEFACHHKNGQLIYLQATNIPLILHGQLVGIHSVVTDITEITQAQQSLTKTKEELEIFWKNSAVPIFYIDAQGDILKVNPAFEETFEFTEEEMIAGKGTIIPKGMKSDQHHIVERILKGDTVKSHDTLRVTKSGKLLNIISSYSPVRNERKEVVGATIIYNNVSELKKIEKELQKSQEKYRLITENTLDIITLMDLSGKIEYVSPASEKVLGFSDHVYIGNSFTQNIHSEDVLHLSDRITALLNGGKPIPLDVRYLHRDGHYIWMEVSFNPVFSNGEMIQLFTLARDVTERKKLQSEIAKMAFYDHLSGIPNRRNFDSKLEKAFLQVDPSSKKIALLMLDGRKFKQINDQFGHDAGDAVIKEMARRLQACVRPCDTAARLGGDEMAVILPDIDSVKTAIDTAKRILTSYEAPFLFNGYKITMGAGIGISLYPDHATSEKQLIKCADLALYEAKKIDRDAYKVYE